MSRNTDESMRPYDDGGPSVDLCTAGGYHHPNVLLASTSHLLVLHLHGRRLLPFRVVHDCSNSAIFSLSLIAWPICCRDEILHAPLAGSPVSPPDCRQYSGSASLPLSYRTCTSTLTQNLTLSNMQLAPAYTIIRLPAACGPLSDSIVRLASPGNPSRSALHRPPLVPSEQHPLLLLTQHQAPPSSRHTAATLRSSSLQINRLSCRIACPDCRHGPSPRQRWVLPVASPFPPFRPHGAS